MLRLLDECAEGHLDLTRVCTVFYDSELPDTIESVRDSVIRAIARSAPVMLLSTGATEANRGERLVHGERLLFHRPAELLLQREELAEGVDWHRARQETARQARGLEKKGPGSRSGKNPQGIPLTR